MPDHARRLSESERILGWYALVQEVYDTVPAIPMHGSQRAESCAEPWSALLARAAVYFGLDELVHCHGRPPSRREPGELVIPLQGATGELPTPRDEAPSRLAQARLARARPLQSQTHYLRARLGPLVTSADALRPTLQRFARHIARRMHVGRELSVAQQELDALYEILDQQDVGIVLCDVHGHARFHNRAAIRLRQRHPQLQLDPSTHESAQGLTLGAQQPLSQLFVRFRRSLQLGDSPLIRQSTETLLLTLVPLLSHATPADLAADGPALGLIVQERALGDGRAQTCALALPEVSEALNRRLQERFGLTPAEARLSYGLYLGLSVATYASLAERSVLTVRKQLKSIYRKLEVSDQKALILRIWQEQRSNWLRCVTLMSEPGDAVAADLALIYPRPETTEACAPAPDHSSEPPMLPKAAHGIHR